MRAAVALVSSPKLASQLRRALSNGRTAVSESSWKGHGRYGLDWFHEKPRYSCAVLCKERPVKGYRSWAQMIRSASV